MRIGYVLTDFPPLSETFIRREILQLCKAGHQVFVYTRRRHHDPLVPEPLDPRLEIREIEFFHSCAGLAKAARSDGIEHFHGSLMQAAHLAAHTAANDLKVPFSLTAYSGHDIFKTANSDLYRNLSLDVLCAAIVVEDRFMCDWLVNRLGADPEKIVIIPNSLDMNLYRLPGPRRYNDKDRIIILAIARFVEKKGLVELVRAFNRLCTRQADVELCVVGNGPLENRLRGEAGQNSQIKFLGVVSEAETRVLYSVTDIFCLPCIRSADGDGDGIPTAILEAMAFELPIVTSDLLSAPYYVRHEKEGLLTPPGDIEAISSALENLCINPELRRRLGSAGRVRVSSLCDIEKNIKKLENIMIKSEKPKNGKPGNVTMDQREAKPLVSIAITCFNRGRFIRQCISSAIGQTYPNIEVVVADDGSTDETLDILKEYGDSIRYECIGQNMGTPYAKNRALLMTSGASRYVAILDSDDFFHHDFVKTCVHYLEDHPEIGLVYTDNVLVDVEGRVLQNQHAVSPWDIDKWLRTRGLRADTWVARRDLVMKTNLHDISLNLDEDFDLFYQLLELTTFAHYPGYLVYIRRHNEQISDRRFELAMCHAANLVKYGYSPQYAYLRARYNPEWIPAIEKGILLGKELRRKREKSKNKQNEESCCQ